MAASRSSTASSSEATSDSRCFGGSRKLEAEASPRKLPDVGRDEDDLEEARRRELRTTCSRSALAKHRKRRSRSSRQLVALLEAHRRRLQDGRARGGSAGSPGPTRTPRFSSSRSSVDTQDLPRAHLGEHGRSTSSTGSSSRRRRIEAVAAFRDESGPQILVSTEAGGEGRNFQFCHMLVNYDLPWNPMGSSSASAESIGSARSTPSGSSTSGSGDDRGASPRRTGEPDRLFEETVGGLDPILGDVETDLERIFSLPQASDGEALARP